MHLTRRGALASATALLVSACTSPKRRPRPVVDPDVALRAAAVARELALIASYHAAFLGAPALSARLAPLLLDHQAHLAALGTASSPGPTPATTPAGGTPTALRAQLRAAERTTGDAHAAAALTASRQLAATLASLAACEASHEVLL